MWSPACRSAYGFDRRTTRIAVAVAMVILPVLVLVYLAAWVLLPDTPSEAQPIEDILRDRRRMPLMIVIGVVLLAGSIGSLGSWFLFDGAPWGLMLIALGVLLWASTSSGGSTPPPAPPSAGPGTDPWTSSFPPPTVDRHRRSRSSGTITDQYATVTPTTVTPTTVTPTPGGTTTSTRSSPVAVVTPRRQRRPITTIGVGIAALWLAGASLLEAWGWIHPEALWMIVTALGIVLVSMLISIIVNRSWVLPFLFVPLAGLLVMLSIAQPLLDGASGERTITPDTVALASVEQHLAAGNLVIDLRDVPLTGNTVPVAAEVGMGRLRVLVPRDADMVITTDVGAGQAEVNGNEITDGVRQHDTRNVAADDPARRWNLRVGSSSRHGADLRRARSVERMTNPNIRMGLQIPSFTYPGVGTADLFERIAYIAVTAEQSGFDSVYVMDHFYQLPLIGTPRREHVRGVHAAVGHRRPHQHRAPRLHGGRHDVPQPGPPREDRHLPRRHLQAAEPSGASAPAGSSRSTTSTASSSARSPTASRSSRRASRSRRACS